MIYFFNHMQTEPRQTPLVEPGTPVLSLLYEPCKCRLEYGPPHLSGFHKTNRAHFNNEFLYM